MTGPARPTARSRVLTGALVLAALLAGVVLLSELLRHPPPATPVTVPPADGDVRDEIVCPQPLPREGQRRQGAYRATEPVEVDSNALYDCPQTFDGRVVRYSGEVVGALMRRDAGVWTQLNDDVYAGVLGPLPAHRDFRGGNAGVGVRLPHALADKVARVGGPQARGDVVTVVGTFHRVDPSSGEVAVILAEEGTVDAAGQPISHAPLRDRQVAGVVLLLGVAALLAGERHVAGRERGR